MEPTEIQEFSNRLKESAESEAEPLTRISLAISILAVLVAMVTVLGHRSHTLSVLEQTRAADQWSQYQAKKIRMDNLALTVDVLDLQPGIDPAILATRMKQYNGQIDKWKHDIAEEEIRARELESRVEHYEQLANRFDLGEALLQIAVVLASVTLFTRNRTYFILGLSIGLAGLLVAASAIFVH